RRRRRERRDSGLGTRDSKGGVRMKTVTKFYGPLGELSRLQSELNRLFSLFVENNKAASSGSSWDPNVDLVDDGERVRVLIELPGIEAEDVAVTVRGRVLTVRGNK